MQPVHSSSIRSAAYDNVQASHVLRGSAGLKMPTHAHVLQRAILTHKLGQTDLVLVLVRLCM